MYTVFEEDDRKKAKMYDLTLGKFETLKEAEEFAKYEFNSGTEDVFIAKSSEYEDGNYSYISYYIKPDSKRWHLFEKNVINNYTKYSLNELIEMFEPAKDEYDDYISEEQYNEWSYITTIEELEDYIANYINYNDGICYHEYYIEIA